MQLCDAFLAQGENGFGDLLRRVSISRLRTYQIYEHIKLRTRLTRLNSESLRKAAPRLWARLSAGDSDLAADLLGIPHQDGFFAKDADVSSYLTEGWQQRVYDELKDNYPPQVLVFYLNHLGIETGHAAELFQPAAAQTQA